MANLKDIRNRIDSVENTKKITRAMKMVATAKLRRAEERVEAARPYARKLRRLIANLAGRVSEDAHPLLEQRDLTEKVLIFVVSTNRGLCGSFNANLFRAVRDYIEQLKVANSDVEVAIMGDKAGVHYKRQKTEIAHAYDDIIDDVTYAKARTAAHDGIDGFLSGKYDHVYVAFNEFISAIQYEQRIEQMLPLSIEALTDTDEQDQAESEGASEYLYEPNEAELLSDLLPRHLEVQMFQALLESGAAEQAARMTAMDNATENAEEMIEELTLEFNRARQAAITTEIMEIVSGSEAMKQ
jgi:F-type H+-transporting ATPase subunit gamma